MGALAFTSSKITQRRGFFPMMPGVTHVPYPDPYRPRLAFDPARSDIGEAVVDYLEEVVFVHDAPPEEIAAIVVEPIQGEGGYVVPPPPYFRKLRALCDKYGILLIDDEIQSGLGRTGRWFAIEHYGVVPDIVCVAKSLANGLPLGAMVSRADLHTWGPGAHANTFGGNPVACAASLKTLELIENKYMANAERVGNYLADRLDRIAAAFDFVGEHRGIGLMRGIEIVRSKASKSRAPELRAKIVRRCFEAGLLLLGCGETSIRFAPPLSVAPGHVDCAAEILEGVLRKLC
jgi:4-aminobutyrate aminotransferase